MQIDFPYHADGRRLTATADEDEHVRDLIEQVLFTLPGERVNRPDFGSPVPQLVFAPLGSEVAVTAEMLIKEALQRWLSDRIVVRSVAAEAHDSSLRITIDYTAIRTRTEAQATFEAGGGQ